MAVLLTNNAASKLASSLTASATTLSVSSGEGAKFPNPTGGNWAPITLIKANGTLEIVRCTARSGDALTIVRAQEGTAAMAFAVGDRVELRLTAAAVAEFMQDSQFSTFIKTLIPAADAAAARATLGAQQSGTALEVIRPLTPAADRLPYYNGSNAASLATLTAFARSLLDDADAAAGRTTLGAAPLDNPAFTDKITAPTGLFLYTQEKIQALGTSSGARTAVVTDGSYLQATANGTAATWSFTVAPTSGYATSWVLELTNGGLSAQTFTGVLWDEGQAPIMPASGTSIIVFTRAGGVTRGYLAAGDSK